jgi:hypothetical protein
MATLKYGSIVTEIKGKLGGHVFQRCGQSLSVRTISARRLTSSLLKSISKTQFGSVASQWRKLSNAQKTNWSNIAPTYPTVDKFGNDIVLSGYQLYQYINKRYLLISNQCVNTGIPYNPPPMSVIDFNAFSIFGASFTLLWSFAIPAGTQALLYVSEPYSSQRLVSNPLMTFCTSIPAGTAQGTNFYNAVYNHFKNKPIVGNSFYWEAVMVATVGGNFTYDTFAQEIILS